MLVFFEYVQVFSFWEPFLVGGLIQVGNFPVKSKIGFMRSLTVRSCQAGRRGEFGLPTSNSRRDACHHDI